jgi:hypothetical protein
MLLLDENNDDSIDIPATTPETGGKAAKNKNQNQQILSEIAEEDDVSTISESLKHSHPYGALASGSKRGKASSGLGTFGPNGKESTYSNNSEIKMHSNA